MNKQSLNKAYWILSAWFYASAAYGQSIDGIVNDGADYLITSLGPALFLVGIVITGISLAIGNINAVRRGVYVVAGGIAVLAARSIFDAISTFAR